MAAQVRLRSLSVPVRLRLAAMALLVIPAGVLLVFGLGEMIGGDVTGVQHIPEAAALLVLAAVAWRRPRGSGIVLVAVTSLLFVLWLAWVVFVREDYGRDDSPLAWIAAAAVLFLPPLVAGWLLLRSSASNEGTNALH